MIRHEWCPDLQELPETLRETTTLLFEEIHPEASFGVWMESTSQIPIILRLPEQREDQYQHSTGPCWQTLTSLAAPSPPNTAMPYQEYLM